jgi:hypothetical protein
MSDEPMSDEQKTNLNKKIIFSAENKTKKDVDNRRKNKVD